MMKASAGKMKSKKVNTTSIAGTAQDDCVSCYSRGQVDHISCNCPNHDLMKKLLEQTVVGTVAPKAKSGSPQNDKKRGGAPTGRKKSGWLGEENEA